MARRRRLVCIMVEPGEPTRGDRCALERGQDEFRAVWRVGLCGLTKGPPTVSRDSSAAPPPSRQPTWLALRSKLVDTLRGNTAAPDPEPLCECDWLNYMIFIFFFSRLSIKVSQRFVWYSKHITGGAGAFCKQYSFCFMYSHIFQAPAMTI